MAIPGSDSIDPGGVDIAVSKDVRQVEDVLPFLPEHSGEEVTQIVGEYLSRIDSGGFGDCLHPAPDIAAV